LRRGFQILFSVNALYDCLPIVLIVQKISKYRRFTIFNRKRGFMKKIALLLIGVLCAFLQPLTSFADEKVYELSFSSPYFERHQLMQNCFLPWIKEMEEKTGGRLSIQFFSPGSLVPEAEIYDSVVNGSLDMGITMTGRNPGKFPYTSAFDEPFIVPGATAGSVALWHLYKDVPEINKEFEETKVLTLYASAPYQLVTKAPVATLEDLAGKKMILPIAAHSNMARLLKTPAILLGWPDIYLSLERGLAEGVYGPIPQVRAAKTYEVCKNITLVDLSVASMYFVMNRQVWDSLPDDLKRILEENTGEALAERLGRTLDEGAVEDGQWLREHGVHYIRPSAEELQKWRTVLAPLHDDWVKTAEARGMKGARGVMDACLAYGEKYAAQITQRGYTGE
jgi:TRAP-type C4-dicarboxylate transport system substrate-binding protein